MFKRRIQELLFENKINQKELAEKIGLTPATLSRNINGLNPPKAEVVLSIAHFFNVSTDYLLGISDIRNPKDDIKIKSDPIYFSLYEEVKELTDEQKKEILEIVKKINNMRK